MLVFKKIMAGMITGTTQLSARRHFYNKYIKFHRDTHY
jgi:hypothetical protein